VLQATRTALDIDGDVLDEDELAQVHGALAALQKALGDKDSRAIHHRIEALDRATQPLAERRMNRAVARAMAGHDLGEFESLVKDRPEHPHLAAMAAQETR
jgi:molecular chaperone HscA